MLSHEARAGAVISRWKSMHGVEDYIEPRTARGRSGDQNCTYEEMEEGTSHGMNFLQLDLCSSIQELWIDLQSNFIFSSRAIPVVQGVRYSQGVNLLVICQ